MSYVSGFIHLLTLLFIPFALLEENVLESTGKLLLKLVAFVEFKSPYSSRKIPAWGSKYETFICSSVL